MLPCSLLHSIVTCFLLAALCLSICPPFQVSQILHIHGRGHAERHIRLLPRSTMGSLSMQSIFRHYVGLHPHRANGAFRSTDGFIFCDRTCTPANSCREFLQVDLAPGATNSKEISKFCSPFRAQHDKTHRTEPGN